MQDKKIGVIGTGNMGESLINGLISFAKLSPNNIYVFDIDQNKLKKVTEQYKTQICSTNENLLDKADIILLCVKPQGIEPVLEDISKHDKAHRAIISIAAGIETSFIEQKVNKPIPVIRVMPNICATVNAAVSALCRGAYASDQTYQICKAIFESIGQVVEVKEELMDVVTGLSGSGPAYIFLVIEALSAAGVILGLPENIATILATQTTLGAAKMVLETGLPPKTLKDKVTSPGGTTIQGLLALEKYNFRDALIDAVKKATARSRELRVT